MIPFVLLQLYPHALNLFALIITWRRLVARRQRNENFAQIIQISVGFLNLVQIWLRLMTLIIQWLKLRRAKRKLLKPHLLLQFLGGYRAEYLSRDIWDNLQRNWSYFFWLTGETPATLQVIINRMENLYLPNVARGRPECLDFRNQVLLTMIWLRRYPTMEHLSMHFGIPVSCTLRIIHKCLKYLHVYLVPKYIRWHPMQYWRNLAGIYPEWPRVVGILDCTPFRISRPKGPMQRIFYRRDRHCFFLNWVVIVDILGFIVLSRPGYIGRAHDSVCFRNVNLPILPQGLQIMADQGFKHLPPVMILPCRNQPQIPAGMRRAFRSRHSMIERCFGILKNSYSAVGTRRFRSRRWNGPLICNVTAALYNRRKLMFHQIRERTGYRYMH